SVDGINFEDTSFLTAIAQNQNLNPNLVKKKEFLAELFAVVINETSSDYADMVPQILDIAGDAATNKEISFKMYNNDYQSFLTNKNYTGELLSDEEFFIRPSILVTDAKQVFQDKYSSVTLSTEMT